MTPGEQDFLDEPFHHRHNCCACGSSALAEVYSVATIPLLSPNVLRAPSLSDSTPAKAPLDLCLCEECGHLQLIDIVDPRLLYTNYAYKTSVSLGLSEHFRGLARNILNHASQNQKLRILEIGSNDGTLLSHFSDLGCTVLGVEPAMEIAATANANGIQTVEGFFSSHLAQQVQSEHGRFDVVVANYMFANVETLDDFVGGVRAVLDTDGVFVIETQYGVDVIEKLLIDTIYHEHISYFTVMALRNLFRRHEMTIVDIQRIPTKGGSIRVFVSLTSDSCEESTDVEDMISAERSHAYHQPNGYANFASRANLNRQELKQTVERHLQAGQHISGFGASVGTLTLLHFYDLASTISEIYDDNPLQQYLHNADRVVPILNPDLLKDDKPDALLLFAWRYAQAIKSRHQFYLDQGGQLILPLPEVQEISS